LRRGGARGRSLSDLIPKAGSGVRRLANRRCGCVDRCSSDRSRASRPGGPRCTCRPASAGPARPVRSWALVSVPPLCPRTARPSTTLAEWTGAPVPSAEWTTLVRAPTSISVAESPRSESAIATSRSAVRGRPAGWSSSAPRAGRNTISSGEGRPVAARWAVRVGRCVRRKGG